MNLAAVDVVPLEVMAMNVVYSSANYHIVEYPGRGFEVINKYAGVGTYLHGEAGTKFRERLEEVIQEDASIENVDEFLEGLDILMTQPAIYH